MKVLIIHHLEPMWESGYNKLGESFESLCEKFVEFLEENPFDKVILTQFEHWKAQSEHVLNGISYYVDQWEEYGYGWEKSMFSDEDGIDPDYCEGGFHSELVYLADWMKELKSDEVYISGAFDSECIEDLEIALSHLEIPFKRINELIL